jgi:6-phosphofructokinase 1
LSVLGVDILFVIGGDGTLKGAAAIVAEINRRGLRKSVIGIPKTIDNDILYLDKTFGFETAFAEAVKAVICAHVEAISAINGIGLVKLMGRASGFIGCYAALASQIRVTRYEVCLPLRKTMCIVRFWRKTPFTQEWLERRICW